MKVGLYTSPHILNFRERIRVLKDSRESEIKEEYAEAMIGEIKKMKFPSQPPTYFECATILAFNYFRDEKVNIAVVEVGMGGKWDATNVVFPELSIITNVGMDHEEFLGREIESIAEEKAGIIKKNRPLVTGAGGKALNLIRKIAKENNSQLYLLGRDVRFEKDGEKLRVHGKDFIIEKRVSENIPLFQMENFSLALLAGSLLRLKNIEMHAEKVDLFVPGRFNILRKSPFFIVDGGHNPHAHENVVRSLKELKGNLKFLLIYSRLKNKSPESLKILRRISDEIWIVKLNFWRGDELEKMVEDAREAGFKNIETYHGVEEIPFRDIWGKRDVLLTGSFYLLREFERLMGKISIA